MQIKKLASLSLAAGLSLSTLPALANTDSYPPQTITCTSNDPSSCTGYDKSQFMLVGNAFPGKFTFGIGYAEHTYANTNALMFYLYADKNNPDPVYLLTLLPTCIGKLAVDIDSGNWKEGSPKGTYQCDSPLADCPYFKAN